MYRQELVPIERVELLGAVSRMRNDRYRLAQISVTKTDGFDFLYSFERDYDFVSLAFSSGLQDPVASIGWLYPYAFLYENEMKDLFGVLITDMNIDYGGNLYKTAIKTPFNPRGDEDDADE